MRADLAAQLGARITRGDLAAGVRLPSTRALASELRVSRGVVVDAYAQLEAEGFLIVRQSARPVVARVAGPREPAGDEPAGRSWRYDLTPTAPDLSRFPRVRWADAQRRVTLAASLRDLDYGDPRGPTRARESLAVHLARTRGARVAPQDLAFTSGSTHALHLLVRALAANGARRVVVEEPSPAYVRAAIERSGLDVVSVAVDVDGIRADRVIAAGPDAVLLTPAHQFPTGVRLSRERRAELIGWATAAGALVIEDDYDGDHLDRRRPLTVLQADAPELVAIVGSAAKALAPSLRIGWLSLPRAYRDQILAERSLADAGPPTLDALAFADLLERGEVDRHLRANRLRYRKRRAAMIDSLRGTGIPLDVLGEPDGLHVAIAVPGVHDDRPVVRWLERRGIKVDALSSYYAGRDAPQGLVLGFAQIPEASCASVAADIAGACAFASRPT